MNDNEVQSLQGRLQARQAELAGEVALLEDERADAAGDATTRDVQDAGDQGEQQTREAIRHAEQERDALELQEIAAAQGRIDSGTYGVCTDCGIDIPVARLQARPEAARCIACQEILERKAGGPGVQG